MSEKFSRTPVILWNETTKSGPRETYGFAGSVGVVLEGQLLRTEAASDTVYVFMHPTTTLHLLPLPEGLAASGRHVLCAASRYPKNDAQLIMEKVVLDLGAWIRWAREEAGYRHVVLMGWSGGGSLALFYQAEAEQPTVTATPAGDPISTAEANLIPADGLVLVAANYRTYIEVGTRVSGACGASGWLTFILNHTDWHLGQMGAAQEAVWGGDTEGKILGPLTPAPGFECRWVEGGTVVCGEWPYSSGSDRAKWAIIGYPMFDGDGPPSMECGLISLTDVTVPDTWQVAGMAGTCSNTIVVPETFIPDTYQIPLADMVERRFRTPYTDEALYRMDAALVFHIATLPSVLGLARAAFEATLERLTRSRRAQSYTLYLDTTKSPATQSSMARASWLVDTAFRQACDIADEIDDRAARDEPFTPVERAAHVMRVAQAHRGCREAMDLILDAGGAGSFALANPVQRMWRDMAVASRHGLSVPGIKEELYGRALLGADEQQMTPLR